MPLPQRPAPFSATDFCAPLVWHWRLARQCTGKQAAHAAPPKAWSTVATFLLSIALLTPAVTTEAASATPPDPPVPGRLWPDHRRVVLIEAANGPAWQSNALACAELPVPSVGESPRLIELDAAGRPTARVPVQIDRDGGKTRLWWPLTGATRPGATRRFLFYAEGPKAVPPDQDDAAPPLRSFDALRVETTDGELRVVNAFFQTVQPERGGGGFPASVTFAHSGLTTAQFYYEDRLYNRQTKAFYVLRNDKDATAKVVQQGPLHTVVEVRAHYAGTQPHTKGNARAVYRYTFRAGSPLIAITAEVAQDVAEPWTELHFLQLSTKGPRFPLWRAGKDLEGRFTGSKNSRTVKRWGVMSNGTDAMGLLTTGDLIWYDDPDGYCNYFQFPVPGWSSKSHRFSGWLYVGPSQPHAVMNQWSVRLANPLKVAVRPLTGLETLRAKIATQGDRPPASLSARYERALYLRLLARDPATIAPADLDAAASTARAFANSKQGKDHQGVTGRDGQAVRICRNGDSLWLANAQAVFHLDLARGGRITQILHLERGLDFIGPGRFDKVPLWRLKVRRQDGKIRTVDSLMAGRPEIHPGDLSTTGTKPPGISEAEIKLTWPPCRVPDCQGTVTARASLLIASDRPFIRARLEIDNALTDAGLWEVQFPVVAPLGQRGRLDVAVPRGNWGTLSRALTGGTGGGYPSGNWPMQYVSATSGPCTLYLGDHHPRCGHKRFSLQAGGEFKFQIDPPDMGKPGAEFKTDDLFVIGPTDGDWFDAARVYREWAHRQIWMSRGPLHERDDVPRKLRDGLTWLLLSGEPEAVVPKVIAAQDFLGVPIGVHWYNWHQIPFDNDYPHYFPVKKGFPEAVKTLKDRGVYVMPYINGRLWDSDTKDFETVARPACTKDLKGKPYIEVYGSGEKLVPMCPTTKVWQDKVCEIIDRLVNEVGVNAVYLDQIAAAGPRQCFDVTHGHPLGGGAWWCPSYWEMMDRIQKIAAAKSPDVFFTTENNAEPYSHNIDAFLVWNPRHPDMIPINAVVYADMRVHFANRVNPADSDLAFAMKVGRDFLWGTQLGWMAPFYLEPAHKNKGVYFRRLAQARLMARKFLAYGQMLRPPEIRCEAEVTAPWFGHRKFDHTVTWPAVAGACWRAPDGHVGLILTNYDDQPHRVDFRASPEATRHMGRHAVWGRLLPDGLHRGGLRGVTQTGHHRIVVGPRDVVVFEVVPCASQDERTRRLEALPEFVDTPTPTGRQWQPSSQRPLWAELRLSVPQTPADELIPGRLVIDGKRPKGNDWRVRLGLPHGYAIEPATSFPISEKAWGPQTIDVLIYPPPGAGAGGVPVDVELIRAIGRENLQLGPPRKKAEVPRAKGTITVDGRFADWGDAGRIILDGRTGNHVSRWTGPADLSADVRLCRDDEHLFMAIDVRDDVHAPGEPDHFVWQGDAIQLAFQPDLGEGGEYANQTVEYGLALTSSGPYAHEWMPGNGPANHVRLAALSGKAGVAYEAAIPLAAVRPGALDTIGFSMTVNESDGDGTFDGWLEWTPGVCGGKSTASFGRLHLAD